MIYYGNRNYGCRFKDVVYHGLKTIILENELISITLLVDRGTDIVSFVHKPTDTDYMWINPVGLNLLDKINITAWDKDFLADNYYGGWFECFPFFGACDYYDGNHCEYAEVKYLPFDCSVVKDSAEEIELKFFARCTKLPLTLEKHIVIKSGIPTVFIKEKITNLSGEECGFMWGHHPNIGGKFIDDSVVIDMPECKLLALSSKGDQAKITDWPEGYIKDEKVDIRSIFSRGEKNSNELYFINTISDGWSAVRNQNKNTGLGLSWDKEVFDSVILWTNYGKSEASCKLDGKRIATIFPKTHRTQYLKPYSSQEIWFNATVVDGNREVCFIDKNGNVKYRGVINEKRYNF